MDPDLALLAGGSVGDIPYGEKTLEDRLTEARMRRVIYDIFYGDYPPYLIERLEAVISHTDHESLAHDIAECGHMLLTYSVGLKAMGLVLGERELFKGFPTHMIRPEHQTLQLSKLGTIVTKRTLVDLIRFADKGFIAAERTVEETKDLYERGHREIEIPN